MFAGLCERFEYFKKHINLFIALAPAVRIDNCTSNLIKKMHDNQKIESMMIKMKMLELFPSKGRNWKSFAFLHKLLPEFSNLGIKILSDDNPKEINQKSLENFLAHFPAGTSFKTVKHFKQLMISKRFEKFDYGKDENLVRYGVEAPPEF